MKIAVDGPAGAGKSTVAKRIAKTLGITYIDSGAMYRAAGYKALRERLDIYSEKQLQEMLSRTMIGFMGERIILDGEDISGYIRTPEVSKMASDISALAPVREKLVDSQRKLGEDTDVIMDGRDIGTNVFPDAEYKFYVTATAEERAVRRQKEMKEKGIDAKLEDVIRDIMQRDHNDMARELNPLKKAEDAIEIDTTGKSIEEVVAEAVSYLNRHESDIIGLSMKERE